MANPTDEFNSNFLDGMRDKNKKESILSYNYRVRE
jgi:hypothetical protein